MGCVIIKIPVAWAMRDRLKKSIVQNTENGKAPTPKGEGVRSVIVQCPTASRTRALVPVQLHVSARWATQREPNAVAHGLVAAVHHLHRVAALQAPALLMRPHPAPL